MRYDYECRKCGHAEEVIQFMSDEPLTKCPACKKKQFRRIITSVNFQMREVKTLGQLAEKNNKKLGKYGVEDKTIAHANRSKLCRSTLDKEKKKPLSGKLDEKTRKKVLKTKESRDKYIYEGKVD